MPDTIEIWDHPDAQSMSMLVGWRQWADAGSISSGLPRYLIQQSTARPIGRIRPDGFYLFQIPGTHDLVRPVIKFEKGLPKTLETQRNEFFYTGDTQHGTVIFLGDEPHLDIERYVTALLDAAQVLGVKRIIGFGGVYGELPYDKQRSVSCVYSLPQLEDEINSLGVSLSDYHGGASIGSYICQRANERKMEFIALYAFVPTYDFSHITQLSKTIRIENDYMAWHGVMQRVNYMLKTHFDLADLEKKSQQLIQVVEAKVEELENASPQLGVREYLAHLSEQFTEVVFEPLADVWEEELRRLLDDSEPDNTSS